MITIYHDDQEIELENLEHAKWALEAVLDSIDDGARGKDRLANLLSDVIAEFEQASEE